MNPPNLFSSEESPVWDPKVTMSRLIISEDQLMKLKSIPGWAKVRTNQNTTLLFKDSTNESSQSVSVDGTQRCKRVEKNIELFNEQVENHKSVLETFKVQGKTLTRSLSLINLGKSKTLKRTSSLPSLCQLFDVSDKNNHQDFTCKVVNNSTPAANANLNLEIAKDCSDIVAAENSVAGLTNQPIQHLINVKSINIVDLHPETVKESNGVLHSDNVGLHYEMTKENGSDLLAEKTVVRTNNLFDQPLKQVTESMDTDNGDLNSETVGKCDGVLHSDNVDLHYKVAKENGDDLLAENAIAKGNNLSDQPLKQIIESMDEDNADLNSETTKERMDLSHVLNSENLKVNSDMLVKDVIGPNDAKAAEGALNVGNSIDNSMEKHAKSHTLVVSESDKLDANNIEEILTNEISISVTAAFSNDEEHEKILFSNSESGKTDMNNIKKLPANEISVPVSEGFTSINAQEHEKFISSNLYSQTEKRPFFKETVPVNYSTGLTNVDYKSSSTAIKSIKPSAFLSSDSTVCKMNYVEKSTAIPVGKSHEGNLRELCHSNSTLMNVPAKVFISDKETEIKCLVENSGSDMKMKSYEKDYNDTACDPAKSSASNEQTKKRKLESKNRRSKKLKSEEKHGNIKIRSIKKVGEICYSSEEVKTMLDIMKQYL